MATTTMNYFLHPVQHYHLPIICRSHLLYLQVSNQSDIWSFHASLVNQRIKESQRQKELIKKYRKNIRIILMISNGLRYY
jgi:hypothetical protein